MTLFAQWKKTPGKPPSQVTFAANGGAGAMAPQRHRGPTALSSNHFTRAGYTFVGWNTAANGSGAAYSNNASFSFASSITLYAQWKVQKVVPPPVPQSGTPIGPFSTGSSDVSSAMDGEIQGVASEIKSTGKKQIALIGFGDHVTTAEQGDEQLTSANIELGRKRAQAVATYLEGRLTSLGLSGWTISIATATSTLEADAANTALVFTSLT